jgi:hypothetical protein
MRLALLLALIMPLQGFASGGCGFPYSAPAAAPAAAPQQCAHAGAAQHHHCGTCCCAAAIAVPLLWVPPRPANPSALLFSRCSPPAMILDRLDRPPRPL